MGNFGDIKNLTVLLVDDSVDDRQWVLCLLQQCALYRCTAVEAECLEEAVDALAAGVVDLIIADWELPDGAGVELARHPTVLSQHIPVIVVTGSERPDLGVSAVGLGAADFLPKDSLANSGLARACAHALVRRELEQTLAQARESELAAARGEREARIAAESALRDERKARERISALHLLSSKLGDAVDLKDIARIVVEQLDLFEHATAMSVFRVDDSALHLIHESGYGEKTVASWSLMPLSVQSPLTQAVRTKLPVRVQDAAALYSLMPTLAEQGGVPNASWMSLPLSSRGEVLGVLGVRFDEGHLPGPESDPYIETMMQTVAQAMARARSYERLRESAQFEERMLAVVGHDLRTPLSALGYAIELFKLDSADAGLVGRMERSIKRMTELVEDVLNRAAVRRGQAPSDGGAGIAELEALVRDQVEELRVALHQAEIGLEIQSPVSIPCERTRTAQIVSNLVRNAVQHGHAGTPVLVRLRGDGAEAELSVHNVGNPIPKEDVASLFNPFQRGNGAGGEGTGLGLYIVHESVTVLGGSIDVSSDAAETVFTVRLPAFEVRASAEGACP